MRKEASFAAIIGLALVNACGTPNLASSAQPVAVAAITDSDGNDVGKAELLQSDDSLAIGLTLTGLAKGARALHLHQHGECEAPSFTSAGGHLNPFDKAHGSLSEDGAHLGDLPNIEVQSDGTYEGEVALSGNANELIAILFDNDGTSIMLHEGADDYMTDPSGAAGPRIACGVFTRL